MHFFLFSTLIRKAYVQVQCCRTAFPRSPRHICTISHIVGRMFLLPVDISSCPVLSATLSLLSAPRDQLLICDGPDFCSVVVNTSTTNSPGIITVTLGFLVATLADPGGRAILGVGLRPLACWDCGFESRQGKGCLSLVSVVCFVR